jgi:membrane-associated PAP2 superfamily phosphatase
MADSRIPHVDRRSFVAPALAVAAIVVFFGLPGMGGEALDLWGQSFFWNGTAWLLPHENALGRALAYDGPKALIIIWALLLIGAAIFAKHVRVRALYLLACLAVVSVVCTQLRAVTGMATPLELKSFGGSYDHLLLFQTKPAGYPSHAFPAGHASGGFALLGLYWILKARRWRGLALGLGVGCWMGFYQVARGEHFLSHTLATAALAWLLCVGLAFLLRKPLEREVSSPS